MCTTQYVLIFMVYIIYWWLFKFTLCLALHLFYILSKRVRWPLYANYLFSLNADLCFINTIFLYSLYSSSNCPRCRCPFRGHLAEFLEVSLWLVHLQSSSAQAAEERSQAALGWQTLVSEKAWWDDRQRLAYLQGGLQHYNQRRQNSQSDPLLDWLLPAATYSGSYWQVRIQGVLSPVGRILIQA